MSQELVILVLNILIKYGPAAYDAVLELLKKDKVTIEELQALKSSFVHYADL